MSNWMTDVEPRFEGRAARGVGAMDRSSLLRALCGFCVIFGFGLLMAFIFVNAMLGCQTWDQSLWTATNSCITPGAVIEGLIGR